ncbi:hypothetical protein BX661DRAFT_176665 [Kickxella alabastrina]|uniref:uncharacterized protein n=1 Tax=Kickxella alabastrina TaxID=61397 RepID=UPI0022208298|nr:uncharacterized protein BX661DRAFT_176665 [Kickxella alabastrina]KAI7834119.1 hypothetical protein BX661DRAFT_176665 [Kickxella alabastrina]
MKLLSILAFVAIAASAAMALTPDDKYMLETFEQNCNINETNINQLKNMLIRFSKETHNNRITTFFDKKDYKLAGEGLQAWINTASKDSIVKERGRYEVGFVNLRRAVNIFASQANKGMI